MKPGHTTTEFYLAIAGIAALTWQQIQARCNFDQAFIVGLVVIVGGYIAQRGWVKSRLK